MPVAIVDDGEIAYTCRGRGTALLLLPGLGCPRSIWARQIEQFSRTHQVIAVDPRGVGDSAPLRGTREILARQAADLNAVLNQAGVDRAVVCGVSYGGVLAQRFALDFPGRVLGLVTVDSFARTRPRSLREAANLALLQATGWLWLLPGLLRPGVRRQYARWPRAGEYMDTALRNLRRWETVKIRYALNRVDFDAELAELQCPVLAITADHPALLSMGEQIANAPPQGQLAVIEDSFDPSNLCRPEEFEDTLKPFLDGLP
ncbi:MAG TPA: alpha/beta hydrolase [Beutenbergiaceae bacterium]|nr:alpha/beta hydrolase [Beutenbergiaceae bacterium]